MIILKGFLPVIKTLMVMLSPFRFRSLHFDLLPLTNNFFSLSTKIDFSLEDSRMKKTWLRFRKDCICYQIYKTTTAEDYRKEARWTNLTLIASS